MLHNVTNYVPKLRSKKYDKKIKSYISTINVDENREDISFIDAIKRYGRNDKNQELVLNYWHTEYADFISNLRIHETLTSGCCQTSKSLFHVLLQIYLSIEKGYNTLWVYSLEGMLNKMVNIQFKPIVNYWFEASSRTNTSRNNTKNNSLYQYNGANIIFGYASSSNNAANRNTSAGKSMVSFPADIAFKEERSQWESGSDAPVDRRLEASSIDTKPIRQIGTPGKHGTGITEAARDCDYHFEPHCICDNCGQEIRLNPEGTLLIASVRVKPNGEKIKSFVGANGRPSDWFYSDDTNPIESTFFGCPHCYAEIPKNIRVHQSYFRCVKTNIKMTEFLDWINSESYQIDKKIKAFIYLSPLLKDRAYNVASDIIKTGIETTDPEDWYQQQIGLASKTESTKLTIEMIANAISRPMPEFNYPDWLLNKL